jgi:hypothetical protein
MSEPRERVVVPLPSGNYICQVDVYYGDPDKPERTAQLSSGMQEAKVGLAKGATVDDCLILVSQLNDSKQPISKYVYCCGKLKPYNPEHHVLGWKCEDEVEKEPKEVYVPKSEVEGKPTLAEDMARLAEEEQALHEKVDSSEYVEEEQPFHDEAAVEDELDLGDELELGDELDKE